MELNHHESTHESTQESTHESLAEPGVVMPEKQLGWGSAGMTN